MVKPGSESVEHHHTTPGVVWCGVVAVWCGVVVWCGVAVWCGVVVWSVWCGVVKFFGVVWCGVILAPHHDTKLKQHEVKIYQICH